MYDQHHSTVQALKPTDISFSHQALKALSTVRFGFQLPFFMGSSRFRQSCSA